MTRQLAPLVAELTTCGHSPRAMCSGCDPEGLQYNGDVEVPDDPTVTYDPKVWVCIKRSALAQLRSAATPNAPAVSVAEHQEGSPNG